MSFATYGIIRAAVTATCVLALVILLTVVSNARAEDTSSPPVVIPPRAVFVEVPYPRDASGSAEVELELIINKDGSVREARAIDGNEPFASAATGAAPAWVFTPALRAGLPVSSRIVFVVTFIPASTAPTRPPKDAIGTPGAANEPASSGVVAEDTEIVVEAARSEQTHGLTAAEARTLPGAFGDPFRALEVLPGMVPLVSGLPYFYVRGAPPGNVGYYFDGVPVPLLYHFGAGPAVIPPQLAGPLELYAGAYPARLGTHAGGVVAASAAPPVRDARTTASVRLLDAGVVVEQTALDGQLDLAVAGRYAYAGWMLALVVPEVSLDYWDYQARAGLQLNSRDRLTLSWFGSGDRFAQAASAPSAPALQDGNMSEKAPEEQSLRVVFHRLKASWEHVTPTGWLSLAALAGLDAVNVDRGALTSGNRLLGGNLSASLRASSQAEFRFGVRALGERISQRIEPNYFSPPEAPDDCFTVAPDGSVISRECDNMAPQAPALGDADYELGFGDRWDLTISSYAELVIQAGSRLVVTPGLRIDHFRSGADSAVGIDPRLRARFAITSEIAAVHGLGVVHQRPSLPIPIPGSGPTLKGGLQRAVQHDAGVEWHDARFSVHGGVFQNLFFDFTDAGAVPAEDADGVRVNGRAIGVEMLARARFAQGWSGLLSYTLSRSARSRGRYAGPASRERTHVLNGALSFAPTKRWLFGVRAVGYTGIPAQYGSSSVERPSTRTPPFWRVDWRAQRSWPNLIGDELRVVAEVMNTTLNQEVVAIDCSDDDEPCWQDKVGPITLPSLGVEVVF